MNHGINKRFVVIGICLRTDQRSVQTYIDLFKQRVNQVITDRDL